MGADERACDGGAPADRRTRLSFVFNRRGLVRACRLAGFEVEAVTPIMRDGASLAVRTNGISLAVRALYASGIRGRSAALRARALG